MARIPAPSPSRVDSLRIGCPPGSHRWTRNGGGPLPQAAAVAREKMERARATGGADALAGVSFTTEMDALYEQACRSTIVS